MTEAPAAWPTLEDVKRRHVAATLDAFRWNKAAAAEALGVSLKTVYNAVHRWGPTEMKRTKPRPVSDELFESARLVATHRGDDADRARVQAEDEAEGDLVTLADRVLMRRFAAEDRGGWYV